MADQHLLEESKTFESFDFDPRLSRAIAQLEFVHPTLIQAKAIPLAMAGKDILARARTGSGKTAAYTLPIIQKILSTKESTSEETIKALILVPTRELAEQVTSHIERLLVYMNDLIKVANLAGQVPPQLQKPMLAENPDIVVATPSRALVHLQAQNMMINDTLQNLVIDEADLILSFGYEDDLRKILPFLPKIYQSFLMSATFTKDIDELKQLVLRKPAILKLEEEKETSSQLTQYVIKCSEFDKFLFTFVMLKLRLLRGKVIFFVNDIDRCYRLKLFLEQFAIHSCVLNSELPLNSRYHIVEEFNRGKYNYLIATDESELKGEMDSEDEEEDDDNSSNNDDDDDDDDESQGEEQGSIKKSKKKSQVKKDKEYGVSRGVDFKDVAAVINFDFPYSAKAYTHRIGRTARGGKQGMAFSFVVPVDDKPNNLDIARKMNRDEIIFDRVEKQQQKENMTIKPYSFERKSVDGFKYRVQDAIKVINKVAIKEARIKEIKREILNSEKLKTHFEDKPKDLEFLRHDKALQPALIQHHLKNVPSYLMPKVNTQQQMMDDPTTVYGNDVTFHGDKKRKKKFGKVIKKKVMKPRQ
ncbi:DEAD-domain-containing protein [Halteromyces radiatus]|uniref:DEAD-domain-containing protein n=1 Tax=Halteromyces radiatus TaxID=101107 RepID=UPI00221F6177|nr:DEAD-domain-containing protein [Halteromyces radiatus]KAI8081642.1 DEAD-domain-containing protein [Halteromyces radiatus]